MANVLWKQGEGYDVHLLRGGPPSKKLRDGLDFTGAPGAVVFIPNLAGNSTDHGIEVDPQDGIVVARTVTPPSYKVHNFILSVTINSGNGLLETEIRVHIHDAVDEIWLTPSGLSVHLGTNETRFTVLARFHDGVIGDITGTPQLTFKSIDPVTSTTSTDVKVSSEGVLTATSAGKTAQVTATWVLPAPFPTRTTPPATVRSLATWADFAKTAIVNFVAGPVVPNKADATSSARDSVQSVVRNAINVLLIAEGFRQPQRGDFNNLAYILAEELRSKQHQLPFPLLKNSINFWSAFVPSEDEGITLLGEWFVNQTHLSANPVANPRKPAPTADSWSYAELIHEVGLPIADEVDQAGISDYVTHWQKFYGPHVTPDRVAPFFRDWNESASRSLLNERNTVFGIAGSVRQRVDLGNRALNDVRADFRRTSDENLVQFAGGLTYGGFPLGATWQAGKDDFGLVSFVCLSDYDLGMQSPRGYFGATSGRNSRVNLTRTTRPGLDVTTAPIERSSRTLFASVWAHECSHAFGLADEYGDGKGTPLPATTVLDGPNVTAKSNVCSVTVSPSGGTLTTFDKVSEIPWLWPRLGKVGMLDGSPTRAAAGKPYQFEVALRSGHGLPFKRSDVVRFRQSPVRTRASLDPFLKIQSQGLILKVEKEGAGGLGVKLVDGTGALVDVDAPVASTPGQKSWFAFISDLFAAGTKFTLIGPKIVADMELRLVAAPIFFWMGGHGPLNVEPDFDPGICVKAEHYNSTMFPMNLPLPPLSRTPPNLPDIIGLWEGGFYVDCGVYRPAGRCRMRSSNDKTLPFCHVCKYLMVDRVDPTQHPALDAFYPEVA